MCGIVGMFSEGGAIDRAGLQRAIAGLEHRGPDARGIHVDPAGRFALGHARLSVIDLAGGDQPLVNEDGTIHAVVNGEIYGFEALRRALEDRGHRFRTHSDSEVLIHLYEERGVAALSEIRGEVAFVLHDARAGLLLAGRDRFGIKPLHWARHGGVLHLASEAKALFAAGVPARWDAETFHTATMLGGPLEDRSFFAGVHQVPPGHVLVVSSGGQRLVRYWDFDHPVAIDPRIDARTHLERLGAALDEAVTVRLRADVPVACYLSGGIDSATVLGMAARRAGAPITTFTLAFDRPEYDESAIAREMAAKVGARHIEVPVGEADFARDLADAVWHAERPLNNANAVAKFRLSRAVREAGIKVVLTGEGADEIFAGYPHYRRDLLLEAALHDPAAAARLAALDGANAVSRGILMPEGEGLPTAGIERQLGFTPTWLAAFATAGRKLSALHAPEFAARFAGRDPLAPLLATTEVSRQLAGRPRMIQSMYLWAKSVLPNFILSVLGDRMEMAHSIEGRLPMLDHHVVEVARGLPLDLLVRDGIEKFALREVARPVVTDTVVRRQKHPFFAPPLTDGPLGELVHDTLRGPSFADVPFFAPRAVAGLLDALPRLDPGTRVAMDAPLLLLVSTALMQQRFALAA